MERQTVFVWRISEAVETYPEAPAAAPRRRKARPKTKQGYSPHIVTSEAVEKVAKGAAEQSQLSDAERDDLESQLNEDADDDEALPVPPQPQKKKKKKHRARKEPELEVSESSDDESAPAVEEKKEREEEKKQEPASQSQSQSQGEGEVTDADSVATDDVPQPEARRTIPILSFLVHPRPSVRIDTRASEAKRGQSYDLKKQRLDDVKLPWVGSAVCFQAKPRAVESFRGARASACEVHRAQEAKKQPPVKSGETFLFNPTDGVDMEEADHTQPLRISVKKLAFQPDADKNPEWDLTERQGYQEDTQAKQDLETYEQRQRELFRVGRSAITLPDGTPVHGLFVNRCFALANLSVGKRAENYLMPVPNWYTGDYYDPRTKVASSYRVSGYDADDASDQPEPVYLHADRQAAEASRFTADDLREGKGPRPSLCFANHMASLSDFVADVYRWLECAEERKDTAWLPPGRTIGFYKVPDTFACVWSVAAMELRKGITKPIGSNAVPNALVTYNENFMGQGIGLFRCGDEVGFNYGRGYWLDFFFGKSLAQAEDEMRRNKNEHPIEGTEYYWNTAAKQLWLAEAVAYFDSFAGVVATKGVGKPPKPVRGLVDALIREQYKNTKTYGEGQGVDVDTLSTMDPQHWYLKKVDRRDFYWVPLKPSVKDVYGHLQGLRAGIQSKKKATQTRNKSEKRAAPVPVPAEPEDFKQEANAPPPLDPVVVQPPGTQESDPVFRDPTVDPVLGRAPVQPRPARAAVPEHEREPAAAPASPVDKDFDPDDLFNDSEDE